MITQSTYTAEITDYASLEESIRQLKVQKLDQEAMLKSELTALVNSVSPAKIVKDSLHNLVSDNGVQTDFVKMGLNLGVDLITARLFGRYRQHSCFSWNESGRESSRVSSEKKTIKKQGCNH
jgi:hypothetical protein